MAKYLASITFNSVCEFDTPEEAAIYLSDIISEYDGHELYLSIDVEEVNEGHPDWLTIPENTEAIIGE